MLRDVFASADTLENPTMSHVATTSALHPSEASVPPLLLSSVTRWRFQGAELHDNLVPFGDLLGGDLSVVVSFHDIFARAGKLASYPSTPIIRAIEELQKEGVNVVLVPLVGLGAVPGGTFRRNAIKVVGLPWFATPFRAAAERLHVLAEMKDGHVTRLHNAITVLYQGDVVWSWRDEDATKLPFDIEGMTTAVRGLAIQA